MPKTSNRVSIQRYGARAETIWTPFYYDKNTSTNRAGDADSPKPTYDPLLEGWCSPSLNHMIPAPISDTSSILTISWIKIHTVLTFTFYFILFVRRFLLNLTYKIKWLFSQIGCYIRKTCCPFRITKRRSADVSIAVFEFITDVHVYKLSLFKNKIHLHAELS